jgi:hypothetical protein
MSVKRFLRPQRREPARAAVPGMDARTWQQHYSTVQSDVYPHMLLEQAMQRRETRAWQPRRQPPLRWVLLGALLVAGVAGWIGV